MRYRDNVFEGYLDDDEQFYDFRTASVSGSNIFDDRTTGVSFYNQFLGTRNAKYLRDERNLVGEIVYMSPEEYYKECGEHAFGRKVSVQDLKSERAADKKTLEHLRQVLTVYKKRFPMAFINYANKGQEGLHRMYVAGEMFGWDSPKHPVLCIRWADEERHREEAHRKYIAQIESSIEQAVKESLQYTYSNMEEFKGQLQFDLDNEFEDFDGIDKPVQFSLQVKNSVVFVNVADVTYNFDEDMIQIEARDEDDFDIDLDDIELDLDGMDEFLKNYLV